MKYLIKCGYCGIKYLEAKMDERFMETVRCPKCNQRNKEKVEKLTEDGVDAFGYKSSPPFPEIKPDKDDQEYYFRSGKMITLEDF